MRKIFLTATTLFFGMSLAGADESSMAEPMSWPETMVNYLSEPDQEGLVRFDYAALKANDADYGQLELYIAGLEATDPDTLSDDEAVAYWANLYNAVTIDVVVKNYPVKSIREIKSGVFTPGPWKKDLVTVKGEKLSLDDIEHDIMRKEFPSPLIHYMVNCASVGCPNLIAGEWKAETLEEDRERAARAFINSPRGVQVGEKGLTVSSIYKWFDEDFGGNKKGVLVHLRDYADDELKQAIDAGIKIRDYDYDWSLNGGSVE